VLDVDASLRGVRILLTRAAESGDDLAKQLERHGADVRSVPLIALGPPPNERELQTAVNTADDYDWLVFSSPNGVRSFSSRRQTPLPKRLRVAAVGAATAEAIREHLFIADVVQPDRFVAEALADAVVQQAANASKVLIVQAEDARPVLAVRLRAAGMLVTAVAGYSNIARAPEDLALRVKDCDVIALASASAVRSLVAGLGGPGGAALQLRGKLLACIGPVTENEARVNGLHVELVPSSSTLESFTAALCSYYGMPRS